MIPGYRKHMTGQSAGEGHPLSIEERKAIVEQVLEAEEAGDEEKANQLRSLLVRETDNRLDAAEGVDQTPEPDFADE